MRFEFEVAMQACVDAMRAHAAALQADLSDGVGSRSELRHELESVGAFADEVEDELARSQSTALKPCPIRRASLLRRLLAWPTAHLEPSAPPKSPP